MVKIVGIIGSLRPDSHSAKALQQVIEMVKAKGAEIEILDLRQMNLPFCDASDEYPDYPDVVLNSPMGANCPAENRSIWWERRQPILDFMGNFIPQMAGSFHHHNSLKS